MGRVMFTVSSSSKAAPAAVFALLTDAATWPAWSPIGSFELERAAPYGGVGVGAIRRFRTGPATSREVVTGIEPNKRFAYRQLSGLPISDHHAVVDTHPVVDHDPVDNNSAVNDQPAAVLDARGGAAEWQRSASGPGSAPGRAAGASSPFAAHSVDDPVAPHHDYAAARFLRRGGSSPRRRSRQASPLGSAPVTRSGFQGPPDDPSEAPTGSTTTATTDSRRPIPGRPRGIARRPL